MENNTAAIENLKSAVQSALDSFGNGFAKAELIGGSIQVKDHKNRLMGTVSADGQIERKFDGKKAMMGALVRDRIAATIKGVR